MFSFSFHVNVNRCLLASKLISSVLQSVAPSSLIWAARMVFDASWNLGSGMFLTRLKETYGIFKSLSSASSVCSTSSLLWVFRSSASKSKSSKSESFPLSWSGLFSHEYCVLSLSLQGTSWGSPKHRSEFVFGIIYPNFFEKVTAKFIFEVRLQQIIKLKNTIKLTFSSVCELVNFLFTIGENVWQITCFVAFGSILMVCNRLLKCELMILDKLSV